MKKAFGLFSLVRRTKLCVIPAGITNTTRIPPGITNTKLLGCACWRSPFFITSGGRTREGWRGSARSGG